MGDERPRRIDAGQLRERGGQPVRQLGAESPGDRPRAAGSQCRVPAARVALGPPDRQARGSRLSERAHGNVRDIEDRRAAVAAMREEEAARSRGLSLRAARRERDRQRDPREPGERRGRPDERRERGVGRVDGVSEPREDREAESVAARLRDREPSGRDDDGVRLQRGSPLALDRPASADRGEPGHERARQEAHVPPPGEGEQGVAHVAGTVGRREELGRFLFLREDETDVLLEEGDLLRERPGAEHLAQGIGRGVGDESRCRIVGRRQDVASAAAADQDLAPAVGGSLEKQCLGVAGRGEDRGHRSGGARADHRHAPRTNCHGGKIRLSADREVYCEPNFVRRLMKTIGILGGIGPESTVDYYRLMIAEYRDGDRPPGRGQ